MYKNLDYEQIWLQRQNELEYMKENFEFWV